MIRINLTPSRKRVVECPPMASAGTTAGKSWLLGMARRLGRPHRPGLVGADPQGGRHHRAASDGGARRSKKADKRSRSRDRRRGLNAKKRELEQLQAAIAKLEKKKRRTPVYVMYDLATILTDPAMDPSDPPKLDIDEVKYRGSCSKRTRGRASTRAGIPRRCGSTPSRRRAARWRWRAQARDASDLSEFVRRLRASGRFGRVTSPDFSRTTDKTQDGAVRNLDWTIGGVVVRRWN